MGGKHLRGEPNKYGTERTWRPDRGQAGFLITAVNGWVAANENRADEQARWQELRGDDQHFEEPASLGAPPPPARGSCRIRLRRHQIKPAGAGSTIPSVIRLAWQVLDDGDMGRVGKRNHFENPLGAAK